MSSTPAPGSPTPASQPPATAAAGPWQAVQPAGWAPPVGYANGVLAHGATRRLYVAGQVAFGPDGRLRHAGDLVAQATLAFANVRAVLDAAGARPEHVVRMRLFVRSAAAYAEHAAAIGKGWRTHLGRWFPAMTLVEVARLYEPEALIEVEADAEIPL
ncbi:MAG: RidA family protein [Planctomycetia bacterium]